MSDPIALLKFAELRLYFRDNEDELYVNEALSKLDNVPWGSEANNGDFSSQLNGSTGSPSFYTLKTAISGLIFQSRL